MKICCSLMIDNQPEQTACHVSHDAWLLWCENNSGKRWFHFKVSQGPRSFLSLRKPGLVWAGLAALLPFRVISTCRTAHVLFASSLWYTPVINNVNTVVCIVGYFVVLLGLGSRALVSLTVFIFSVFGRVFYLVLQEDWEVNGFRSLNCDLMHPGTFGNLHFTWFSLVILL